MSFARLVAFGMLAVWASWITALQAVVVTHTPLGSATPDLSFVVLFGCAARLHRRDVVPAALVVALARLAHSVDPPEAILVAYLGAALVVRAARRVADLDRPASRVGLGGLFALLVAAWLTGVHGLRAGTPVAGPVALLPGAFTTALSCLLAGGFTRLPGLSPLRRRPW